MTPQNQSQGPKGRFITLEGGEGVGKSRLLQTLAAFIRSHGPIVVTTREPGGTAGADRIRSLFGGGADHDPWLPLTEALLVSAARAQHIGRVIRPALESGSWVLSDRFADSTRVYQGALGGVPRDQLDQLIDLSTGGMVPDLTIVLDCDVDLALGRLRRAEGDRHDGIARFDHESRERHAARREAYRQLARDYPSRCVLIDAGPSPETVAAVACTLLAQRFPELKSGSPTAAERDPESPLSTGSGDHT